MLSSCTFSKVLAALWCFPSSCLSHALICSCFWLCTTSSCLSHATVVTHVSDSKVSTTHLMHGHLSCRQWLFSFSLTSSHTIICHMSAPSASSHHHHIPTSPATASTLSFRAETLSNMHVWCLCHVHFHYFWLCGSLGAHCVPNACNNQPWISFLSLLWLKCIFEPLFEAPVLLVWVFNTKSLFVTGLFGVRKGVERGKALFFGGKTAKIQFFGYMVSFWCQIPWFDLVGS